MTLSSMLIGVAIMFAVTYSTRALGLLLIRKPIRNRFIRSFLYYLPYSVLAVMVFPSMLFASVSLWAGIAGSLVALVLAFFRRGLLIVSLASIATVFFVEILLLFLC